MSSKQPAAVRAFRFLVSRNPPQPPFLTQRLRTVQGCSTGLFVRKYALHLIFLLTDPATVLTLDVSFGSDYRDGNDRQVGADDVISDVFL